MKYKIALTKQAVTDLRVIYEYIAFTLLEPKIAARQLERLEKAIRSLDEMPERFREFGKDPSYILIRKETRGTMEIKKYTLLQPVSFFLTGCLPARAGD